MYKKTFAINLIRSTRTDFLALHEIITALEMINEITLKRSIKRNLYLA